MTVRSGANEGIGAHEGAARRRGALGNRTGSVEDCTERLGVEIPDPFAIGRGGARLAAMSAIVDRMMSA